MDVKRYEPVHEDAMAADADGRFVTFADYAKLRVLYEAAWEECELSRLVWSEGLVMWKDETDQKFDRSEEVSAQWADAEVAHDALRKEAGL